MQSKSPAFASARACRHASSEFAHGTTAACRSTGSIFASCSGVSQRKLFLKLVK